MFIIENLDFEIDGFRLKVNRLDLSAHKISAIMGPSGAGKTTLFPYNLRRINELIRSLLIDVVI